MQLENSYNFNDSILQDGEEIYEKNGKKNTQKNKNIDQLFNNIFNSKKDNG